MKMEYKRSQAIWALWHVFGNFPIANKRLSVVPKGFARRLSNLIDRGAGLSAEKRAGQKGVDQAYDVDDILELGIALDLHDVGLPQADIANFCNGFRNPLRRIFSALPEEAERGRAPAYLLIRPRAIKETLRAHERPPALRYAPTAFYAPQLVSGDGSLGKALTEIAPNRGREKGIVIEIGDLKTSLCWYLRDVPKVRRGRQ